MFAVKGNILGRANVAMAWDDGQLQCDPDLMQDLLMFALIEGCSIPGMPTLMGHDVFNDELYCWVFLDNKMQNMRLTMGNIPKTPKVPAEAIP